eukprot:gene508-1917_t
MVGVRSSSDFFLHVALRNSSYLSKFRSEPQFHAMLRQMTSIGYRRAALFARRPPLSCVGPHGAVQRGTTSTQRSMCCSVGKSREFPTEPRVAIGITVFRQWESKLQVLLIKRGKEPNKGEWCFPGGSVELGEKIADCAAREVQEETGLAVFNQGGRSPTSCPTTYDAADIIWKQDDGNMRFHYVVVEKQLVAVVDDPKQKQLVAVVDDPKQKQLVAVVDDPKQKQLVAVVDDPKQKQLVAVVDDPKQNPPKHRMMRMHQNGVKVNELRLAFGEATDAAAWFYGEECRESRNVEYNEEDLVRSGAVLMAAVVKDPKQKPEASDDADAAEWFDVSALESLPNLVKDCDWLTAKAANMFQLHDKDIHAQQS